MKNIFKDLRQCTALYIILFWSLFSTPESFRLKLEIRKTQKSGQNLFSVTALFGAWENLARTFPHVKISMI